MTKLTTYAVCLCLAATPLAAQDKDSDLREGMDLLSEGTKLLLRGLMGEIEPALRELEGALRDMHAYHPPEVLPNGDIIIRRKVPLTAPRGGDVEIEL
ncbi:MAG: hypothetical protein QNJ16_08545 [Rhodobacter sp.]|nr:hypothetical protein [Rhodobacter sp.]